MRGGRKTERADCRGGAFFMLPHCLLNSEAFRTASARAIKMLLAICAKHRGFNNGRISVGFRELAAWSGCQNHAANNQAIGELVGRGMLAVACEHPRARRLSTEYRLTFLPTESGEATNDYLHWRQGDAGTVRKRTIGNFDVAITATGRVFGVATTTTGEETSRCDDRSGNHEKPPFSDVGPVAITATHIRNHLGGLSSCPQSSLESPPNTGGPSTVAPDPEALRQQALTVLGSALRGAQGQLASLASIRPAALSKYLHNSGTLNAESRIRLTMALPKIAAMEAA